MIGKKVIKHHYLKKKNLQSLWKIFLVKITRTQKRVCKGFEIKNLGEYHDLYVQSDTLLLADVFENFRNMCLVIYELDPANFFSAPGLALQAALKKTKVKLDLLTDIVMLLIVEKDVRGGICHSIYRYTKTDDKYMKDYT